MAPEPFRIDVSQALLDDLQLRLQKTRWPVRPRDDQEWKFGTSNAYLKDIAAYFMSGFDWRKQEASLNDFSQFKARIRDARIHFIHEKGHGTTIPLLLLHGWPDSFYRYYKVIRPLAAGRDGRAFDVVVPSLPGFGFTGAARFTSNEQPTRQSATLLWRLMTGVLGYERFAVAGGDGGGAIAQILAIDHPESIIGIHLTDLGWHVGNVDPSTVSKAEQKYLEASKKRFMADGAYAMLQSTKPRTLAPALTDSPIALASWILDRFHSWSDSDGHIERSFTRDELLTNIMIYWVTNTIGSSMATYRGDTLSPSLKPSDYVGAPVGLCLFPKDMGGIPPRPFAERTLNVQRWTEMPRGSHFTALEEPELYANDVTAFFSELEPRAQTRGAHA